jgi:hypothetical protein
MPVSVSMGSASKTQKRRKATYTDGPERLYTYVYTHYKRCCARNHSLSNYASRAVSRIRHGQRLHRFCNIIQFFKEQQFFCHQSKKEYSLLSQVFSFDRQEHWVTKRPDNKTDWPKNFETLPHTTEANHFSRRRTATHFCVSNQQFSVGCINHLPDLQTALADRIILQVDQTTLANKVGTSINAVKTQIWIGISVYVLVAIIKKELKLERSLHEILQILSILLFEKTSLKQALTENYYTFKEQPNYNKLSLFDL